MRIAHISDTHIATANPGAGGRLADLAAAVRAINELAEPVDAVIHSGDIAHDASAADYAAARCELVKLKAPLYTTIGNRDRRDPYFEAFGADGYLDRSFGYAQYGVNLGSVYLVAVDTQYRDTSRGGLGGFCIERAQQLRGLLAQAQDKPTLVFAHHPPVELDDDPKLQFREAPEAALLRGCLEGFEPLVGLLTGHVHRAHKLPFGHVQMATIPSLAADLSREKTADAHLRQPIFYIHTVAGRELSTEVVALPASAPQAA